MTVERFLTPIPEAFLKDSGTAEWARQLHLWLDNISRGEGVLATSEATVEIVLTHDEKLDLVSISQPVNLDAIEALATTALQPILAPYERHIVIPSGQAAVGGTAPTPTTIGTSRGLAFNADAEKVYLIIDIPTDWDHVSDMCLCVHWCASAGDAVQAGETVKWDIAYHSVAVGEAVDNGTVATATATHTQGSSAGPDKGTYDTHITLPRSGGNQPIVADDHLKIQFDRDVTGDTYTGDATVIHWHFEYTSIGVPTG